MAEIFLFPLFCHKNAELFSFPPFCEIIKCRNYFYFRRLVIFYLIDILSALLRRHLDSSKCSRSRQRDKRATTRRYVPYPSLMHYLHSIHSGIFELKIFHEKIKTTIGVFGQFFFIQFFLQTWILYIKSILYVPLTCYRAH